MGLGLNGAVQAVNLTGCILLWLIGGQVMPGYIKFIVQVSTMLETGGTVRPADRTGVKLLKSPRTNNIGQRQAIFRIDTVTYVNSLLQER